MLRRVSGSPASAAAARAATSHMATGSGAGSSRQVRRATPMTHGVLGSIVTSGGAGSAGELDCPVGDDVLLHLGRASADGAVPLEGVEPGPLALVDGVRTAPGEEAGGPEQVDGKVGQALREARPLKLGEGHLGPVLLSLDDFAESPEREQSSEFDV